MTGPSSELIPCSNCGVLFPPNYLDDDGLCAGCPEKEPREQHATTSVSGPQPISVGIWNEAKERFDDAEESRFVTSAGYTIVVCRDCNGYRVAIAFDKDGKPVSIGLE